MAYHGRKPSEFVVINTAVRRQKTNLISEIVQDSYFTDTAYNSTYVCIEFDSKKYFATIFRLNLFDTR